MKILFISTEDAKYGAPKSMQKLMQTLIDEYGVECVLLTKKHNLLNDWCDKNGIENYSCNYRDIMAGDSYELWILNFAKHVIKRMRYIKGAFYQSKVEKIGLDFDSIDLIHSNSNRVDIGAYISNKYGIRHVWHLREMDEGTKNMHYYRKDWAKYMNSTTDCFIAITEAVKASWIRHGLDKDKVRVIYNGIDPNTICTRKNPILEDDIIKIVSVGRIERAKGQLDIINALCELPEEEQKKFQIDFVGEAYEDYKRMLDERLKKCNCKVQVNYRGYCSDVGSVLQNYDVGITCSAAEAFGRTTVEYMMAGLLTIASDTGANTELITNEKSGVIYPYQNSNRLSEILSNIRMNRQHYSEIARQGREHAIDMFNSKNNADKIYELYNEMKI